MVSNPMQRKARNSFLLGMLLMLAITGLIIGLLFVQLKSFKDKEAIQRKEMVNISVLNQDVKSGQVITEDMLETKQVNKNTIPDNAIGNTDILEKCSLQDKEGNSIKTKNEDNKTILYITKNNKNYILNQEENTQNYYIEKNGDKEYIELNNVPVIAKINMTKKTVLTRDLVEDGNNKTTDDIRKQEYNMIILPTQIQTGDYIDIRISLPSEQDYIVVSKKEVEIPNIGGIDSKDTIWLNLSEDEILAMNSAIIEAYKIEGSKIYASTYTEPGIQKEAIPTFPISAETFRLQQKNPNIVEEIKAKLRNRYQTEANISEREEVNKQLQINAETSNESVKTKVQESIVKTQEERKQYLDGMTSEE